MSERENLDIGKVVSLIMENPALIEQIANLAGAKSEALPKEDNEAREESHANEQVVTASSENLLGQSGMQRRNRAQLLGALKPYVSSERAKAIDSMISIADILDMMKTR